MMIDLNEPPLDVESINISVELGAPFLHAGDEQEHQHLEEEVGESPDPNVGSNTTHVPDNRVAAPPPMVAPANALVHEAHELEDEEAGSQPQQPYVGMRFDTLEDAREHYNRYALMEGFSIKSNTSYRSAYTGVVEKQQFCCNKFRKPVERVGIPDVPSSSKNTTRPSSPEQDVEEDVEEHTFKKKRKRETVKQTKCRAKMVVKLKDDRWEVITFIADHNHPLIEKPSLSKYLRSHQGIPPEQKKLLTHLNDCNLTAGTKLTLR